MTATTLPRTAEPTLPSPSERLAEVDRQLAQVEAAIASGVHGWAELAQDKRRELRTEKADLLGRLGFHERRLELLRELALEA